MEMKLSPLLKVDKSLNDDTILYRTLDFYSAADLITKNKLMFTRADQFEDPNEGIDRLLAQLEASLPESGCGMGWTNLDEAIEQHDYVKKSYSISCWSRNPESVAMWSLYSSDLCSVRVSTPVSKLKKVVSNYIEQHSPLDVSLEDEGTCKMVAVAGKIKTVDYSSLGEITKRVSRRLKAQNRILERYKRKGLKRPFVTEMGENYFKRKQKRKLRELNETCNLKDISFKHEDEVRLSVQFGETKSIGLILRGQPYYFSSGIEKKVVDDNLQSLSFLQENKIPKRNFLDCPEDLIESVAIDPRCPQHKKEFISNWFNNKGIEVVESSCFGYIANKFDIFPDW